MKDDIFPLISGGTIDRNARNPWNMLCHHHQHHLYPPHKRRVYVKLFRVVQLQRFISLNTYMCVVVCVGPILII